MKAVNVNKRLRRPESRHDFRLSDYGYLTFKEVLSVSGVGSEIRSGDGLDVEMNPRIQFASSLFHSLGFHPRYLTWSSC